MSRAFMKERDDLPPIELTLDPGEPRPITAAGLRKLRARIEGAAEPERQELERLADVVFVPDPPADPKVVDFGAAVTLEGPEGEVRTFALVGEDEIDIERGRVGIGSPLAEALLGKRAGSTAVWKRPAGDRKMRIRSISYD
jgi:transcription elongation GreA/GreB family factor